VMCSDMPIAVKHAPEPRSKMLTTNIVENTADFNLKSGVNDQEDAGRIGAGAPVVNRKAPPLISAEVRGPAVATSRRADSLRVLREPSRGGRGNRFRNVLCVEGSHGEKAIAMELMAVWHYCPG
jgi:hypothetical protein